MWAFSYHLRVDDEAGRQYVNFDAMVAAIISQTCTSLRADHHPIEANLQFMRIVKDIIRIDYGHLKFNVLKFLRIKLDLAGESTIVQDEDGFWLVKHRARQSLEVEPYRISSHAREVGIDLPRCPGCFLFYEIIPSNLLLRTINQGSKHVVVCVSNMR